jgi:hypothetical protein
MEAKAKLLGHPIHQMLVGLPLGLLVGACDPSSGATYRLTQQNSAMTSFAALLSKWPVVCQIRDGKDGIGPNRCPIKRARCDAVRMI